jgi:UPF0755 protein
MADSTDQISDPLAARRSAATASSFSADPSGRIGSDSRRITPRSPRAALEPERVPMPTKWSKSARHPLVIAGNAVFTILILLAIIVGVGFVVGKHRFEAPGPLAEDKVVNIPPRSGIRDIADLLTNEGVIEHASLTTLTFIAGSLIAKTHEELRFGEYQFSKQASLQDVLNTLVSNKVVQHQVTIAEGLTSEQIVQRLLDADMLAGNIREIPREGSLLPESYRFTRSTPRDQVIQRMQAAQQRVLKEVWDHRAPDLPLRSPDQLVTLASIVEKETGRADERTRVAAVFVNRLNRRMRLQSDPTIIYGLVGGKGTLGRPIMRSEIEQPTPYNTYVIDGLPPGPIANPGRASLEAAANPARTRELYFVADGSGGHAFAETYEQHQRNVVRLRAMESSDPKDQAAVDPQGTGAAQQPAASSQPPPAAPQRRAPARHNQNPLTAH